MILASDIITKPVSWLWESRVPYGIVTLLDGDPGSGKSTLAVGLAAQLTRGGHGAVHYTLEDPEYLAALLDAAGGDRRRFGIERDPMVLPEMAAHLDRAIGELRARLVVVDPIDDYIGCGLNNRQAAREMMLLLAGVAERTGAAVLGIRHTVKGGARRALHAGVGTGGIMAVARSALLTAEDPEEDGKYIVAVTKPYRCERPRSVRYDIVPAAEAVMVEIIGECDITAEDLLDARGRPGPRPVQREDAKGFLAHVLAAGKVRQIEVEERAKTLTISEMTLRRAKDELGVRSKRTRDGWWWELPAP
jgi:hypothetical protein